MSEYFLGLMPAKQYFLIFCIATVVAFVCLLLRRFAQYHYGARRKGGLLDLVGDISTYSIDSFEIKIELVKSRFFKFKFSDKE